MNPFRSKNPWELLVLAAFFGLFGFAFLLSDQPLVLSASASKGSGGSTMIVRVEDERMLGALSALIALGLVVWFFWVRHELKNNRWRK